MSGPRRDAMERDPLRESRGSGVEPERLTGDGQQAHPHHPLASLARDVAPAVDEVRSVRMALAGPPWDDASEQHNVGAVDEEIRAEKKGAWPQSIALRAPAGESNEQNDDPENPGCQSDRSVVRTLVADE